MKKPVHKLLQLDALGSDCYSPGWSERAPNLSSSGLSLHLDFLLARKGIFHPQTLPDNFCFRTSERLGKGIYLQ